MVFIRIKRVTRPNGKTYVYRHKQASVRVGKKVKSFYLGVAGTRDYSFPGSGMIFDQANAELKANEQREKGSPPSASTPIQEQSVAPEGVAPDGGSKG